MPKQEKKQVDVTFVTSVALAANDIEGVLRHFQISICQETESKKFRAYFDVVDSSKVKLAE